MEYIITGEDSVVKHWLDKGADGFRLDVADELPDEFIKVLTDTVHAHKPGSLVLGEVWEDASNKIAYSVRRKYFSDCELDSVMNYPFMNAIISLCMDNMSVSDFEKEIMTICENYPKPVTDCLMNSLSTHDTARILTVLSGADSNMSKHQKADFVMNDEQRATAVNRLFIAVFLQFILPGCPCIYYGDEIAMEGFNDPFNRGYFKWENQGNFCCEFFKQMSEIKNNNEPLKTGNISFGCHNDIGVMHISRIKKDQIITATINKGNTVFTVNIPKEKCIISHNATVMDDKILIHNNGFALFI
jgi:glycosidase